MHNVLCLDDCPSVLEILESTLNHHRLFLANSIESAVELLKKHPISLALLDVSLPDGTSLELAASQPLLLRNVPVIYLTSKNDFSTKVTAFSLGADDYIQKPFDPRDLRLRVDARLKKIQESKQAALVLRLGNLICDINEQRVYDSQGSQAFPLTGLEFKIFHLLARHSTKIFTREEILERVWGTECSVTERAIDVHISHLRKKISKSNVSVEGVIGLGYRLQVTQDTNQAVI